MEWGARAERPPLPMHKMHKSYLFFVESETIYCATRANVPNHLNLKSINEHSSDVTFLRTSTMLKYIGYV